MTNVPMRRPPNSFHRLFPFNELTNNTLLIGGQEGGLGNIPLGQLAEFIGASLDGPTNPGNGGSGFVFEDLTPHVNNIAIPSTATITDFVGESIRTGNDVAGSVTMADDSDFIFVGFKVTAITSFRFRLFNGQLLRFLTAEKAIDFEQTNLNVNAIIASSLYTNVGGDSQNVVVTLGDTNTESTFSTLSAAKQSIDWMTVTQSGQEIIYAVNGVEVARLPQSSAINYVYFIVHSAGNGAPKTTLQYDLSSTISGYYKEVNISALANLVIYQAPVDLKVLGKYISKNDYFQLYADKTKIISYPQLSRVYDFDTTAPENLISEEFSFENLNPLVTAVETTPQNYTVAIPESSAVGIDFANVVVGDGLDRFEIINAGTVNILSIRPDFDLDSLESEASIEFYLNKERLFNIYNTEFGTSSDINLYIYTGNTNANGYLRLEMVSYPTPVINCYKKSSINTSEELLFVDNTTQGLSIALKDGLSYRCVPVQSLIDGYFETADKFTKILEFAGIESTVLAKLVVSVSQEALESESSYSKPLRGAQFGAFERTGYVNIEPMVVTWGEGSGVFEFEKEKGFSMLFRGIDTLEDYYDTFVSLPTGLTNLISVEYNPGTAEYTAFLSDFNSGNVSGVFTLASNKKLLLTIKRTADSMTAKIGGLTLVARDTARKLVTITSTQGVFSSQGPISSSIKLNLTDVTGITSVNADTILPRDRVRIVGKDAVIHGKTVKVNDIIEFVGSDQMMLVTKSINNDAAPTGIIPLTILDYFNSPATSLKAWYCLEQSRIVVSGKINYSGYGTKMLFKILLPSSIQNLGSLNLLPLPIIGNSSVKAYAEETLSANVNVDDRVLEYSIVVNGGQYVYGAVYVPDATAVFI